MKEKEPRRQFIRQSAMALGALALRTPATTDAAKKLLAVPDASLQQLRIVCAGAHPGDPEFGCGGTMAKYRQAGHQVTFLYLTRGEAGDPTKTYAASAALRTKEAEVACHGLGVTPRFAGQVDGNTVLSNKANEDLLKILMAEKPDLVFTQWPVDMHPDHQVTGLLVLNAWKQMNRQFDLYFYEVNTGSETMAFVPTDYVDITAFHEQKKSAMYAHQTQDPVNTYNSFFKAMEAFRGLEAGVASAEAFIHFKTRQARAGL